MPARTLSQSEIMFLPRSADLFLGQQLQGLLNAQEPHNVTKGNKLEFSLKYRR